MNRDTGHTLIIDYYWIERAKYQSLLFKFRLEKSCKSYQGSMGLDKAPYEKVPEFLA